MIFIANKESITMAISFVSLLILASCSTAKTDENKNDNSREVATQKQNVSTKANFVKLVRNDHF